MESERIAAFKEIIEAHKSYHKTIREFEAEGVSVCDGTRNLHLHMGGEVSPFLLCQELGFLGEMKDEPGNKGRTRFSFMYDGVEVMWLVGGE